MAFDREDGRRGGGRSETALAPSFFSRPAREVARDLLGTVLVSSVGGRLCSARIVETEAYVGPHDDASHAAERIGRTARNASMFGPPGIAYVYRIYGTHWCLNAVTDAIDFPAAVLIRAAEPLEGIEVALARRGSRPVADLMRGPGNLCRSLGITGELDGHPLIREPLQLLPGSAVVDAEVMRGPRIGISRAAELPLRFWIRASRSVSRHPARGGQFPFTTGGE